MITGVSSSAPRVNAASVGIVLAALVLALFAGLAASLGNIIIIAVVGGVIGGGLLLARPWWMLSGLLLIVYFAHGMVQFFLGFGQLQWVASILGMALMVVWAVQSLGMSGSRRALGITPVVAASVFFMAVMIVSSVANTIPFMQGIVGFRAYVPFWGAFLFLVAFSKDQTAWKRIFTVLMIVAVIQWPVELYQKLFVVTARSAAGYFGSAFDSVVGTFGGAMFGGGESGSLAVFLAIVLVLVSALHKSGQISHGLFAIVFASSLVAIGLSETKAVFVLIPIGFLWLYRGYIVKKPVSFLVGSAVASLLLAGILTAYYKLHWEEQANRIDPIVLIQQRFLYSFDPSFMPAPDWPGRLTGLVIWHEHHDSLADSFGALFGHGAGSSLSVSSLIGRGDASKRHGMGLDVTGATKLLWESGLLGLCAFLGMTVVAFVQSGRLAKRIEIPDWDRAVLQGVQAAMPLVALAIFYEATAVSSPPMQLTFLLLLAYVDFWYRRVKGAAG